MAKAGEKRRLTFKDSVHGGKVGADGYDDHGECEGEELKNDVSFLKKGTVRKGQS